MCRERHGSDTNSKNRKESMISLRINHTIGIMESNLDNRKKGFANVEVGLIIFSVSILIAFLILMIVKPDETIDAISGFFWKLMSLLGPFFEWFAFAMFILAIYLGVGKYGKVRLGDTKPEYNTYSYIAMMILASLASAALYWSFAEWAFYYEAPGLGMEPHSTLAMETGLSYQFYHWGFSMQALYTVLGVAIAYGVYVRKVKSFQTSAVCRAMMGERLGEGTKTALGKAIDFIVIFGILGGLSSTLGLAVPLATGGLDKAFGLDPTLVAVQIGVIAFIAVVYCCMAFVGIDRGMKVVSNLATYIAIALLLWVLLTGPTTFILKNLTNSFGHLIVNYPRMMLFTDPIENSGFPESWTIYFIAFYLNYLAMMGIFIAKVSKGRTIRQVTVATILGMTTGSIALFGINGSFSIHSYLTGKSDVVGLVNSGIGQIAVYEILDVLPLGAKILPIVILVLIVCFVAPSMDAASLALAETVTKQGTPKMPIRMFWCVMLAIIPMSIVLTGTAFDAIKYIAILISIPFLIIMVGVAIGLTRWLKQDNLNGLHEENIALQEKERAGLVAELKAKRKAAEAKTEAGNVE